VALEVLETAVVWRVEELTPRGLGNVVWAYAKLLLPEADRLATLASACV